MAKDGLLPEGFEVLSVQPKLYYKIEADNGVVVTGMPEKTFFNYKVVGGGHISGGLKWDGSTPIIYGDYNYNNRRYPLRWVTLAEISQLPPPGDRRNKPRVHPWKEHMTKESDQLEDYVSKEAYNKLKREHDQLIAKFSRVEAQVAQVKDKASKEIQSLREEFHKKVKVRSVHLESTMTRAGQVEGHKTEHWEVGDKKYLVIAETPSGLGAGSWVEDITLALNRVATGDEVTVAVVPSGASVRVVEMIPIGNETDDLDVGQF
jgi:hypothetical protein